MKKISNTLDNDSIISDANDIKIDNNNTLIKSEKEFNSKTKVKEIESKDQFDKKLNQMSKINTHNLSKRIEFKNTKNKLQVLKTIEEHTKAMKSEIMNSKLAVKQDLLNKNNVLMESASKSIKSINNLFNDFKIYLKNNPDKVYQLSNIKAKYKNNENNFKNTKEKGNVNFNKNKDELKESNYNTITTNTKNMNMGLNMNKLKQDLNSVKNEFITNLHSNISTNNLNGNSINNQMCYNMNFTNENHCQNEFNSNVHSNIGYFNNASNIKNNLNNDNFCANNNVAHNNSSFDFQFTNPFINLKSSDNENKRKQSINEICKNEVNQDHRTEKIQNNNQIDLNQMEPALSKTNNCSENLFSTPVKKNTNIEMPNINIPKKNIDVDIIYNCINNKNIKSIFNNEKDQISETINDDKLLNKKRKKCDDEIISNITENSFKIVNKNANNNDEKELDLNTSETISNIPDVPENDNKQIDDEDISDHLSEFHFNKVNLIDNNTNFDNIEINIKKEITDNMNYSSINTKTQKNSFTLHNDINRFGIEIVGGKMNEFDNKQKFNQCSNLSNVKLELNEDKNLNQPLFNSLNSEKLLELLLKNINFNNNQYIVNNIYLNNDNIRNLQNPYNSNYLLCSSHNLYQNTNNLNSLDLNNLNNNVVNFPLNSGEKNSNQNCNLNYNTHNTYQNEMNRNKINSINSINQVSLDNLNPLIFKQFDDNCNFSNNLIHNLRTTNKNVNENGSNFHYELNKEFKAVISKEEIPIFLECLQLLKDAYNEFEIIIKNEIEEKNFCNIFISEKIGVTNNEKIEKSLYFIINNLNLGKSLFNNEFNELNPNEIPINFSNTYPLLKFLTLVIKKVFFLYIDSKYNIHNFHDRLKTEMNITLQNSSASIPVISQNTTINKFEIVNSKIGNLGGENSVPYNFMNQMNISDESLKTFYNNLNLESNFSNFNQFKNTILLIRELINSTNLKKKYDIYKMTSLTNFEIIERKKRVKNKNLLNENKEVSEIVKENKSVDFIKYSSYNDDFSKKNKKIDQNESNSRAKYQMFSAEEKSKAIALSNQIGIKQASIFMNVPIKSLKRWLLYGPNRLKGGGRKIKDPEMEHQLIEWYNSEVSRGKVITVDELKDKALSLTKCKEFLASKGWVEKIRKKYNLVFQIIPKVRNVKSEIKNEQINSSSNNNNDHLLPNKNKFVNIKVDSNYIHEDENGEFTKYRDKSNSKKQTKNDFFVETNFITNNNNNKNLCNPVKIEVENNDFNTNITADAMYKIDRIIMGTNSNSNANLNENNIEIYNKVDNNNRFDEYFDNTKIEY